MQRRLHKLVRQMEPEVLRAIGEESRRNGTDRLSSRQIESAIKAARTRRIKRRLVDSHRAEK